MRELVRNRIDHEGMKMNKIKQENNDTTKKKSKTFAKKLRVFEEKYK